MACEEGSTTIPQDIIIDILHRLPAKSIGQFRCVSKEWLSLLSEPGFIKTHEKTLNRTHLIFLLNKYFDSIYSLSFDNHKGVSTLTKLPIESRTLYIQGCCNGLVLVYASFDVSYKDTFYVLNPTIKDYVEFSASAVTHKHICNLYGFGYDSVTDDYKVVAISYYHYLYLNPPDNDVYVYSLRSDTWRNVSDSPFNHYYGGDPNSGVFLNGFLHWIAGKDSDHGVIAAFSLADEKFSQVPSPYLYNDVDILSDNDHCKLVALGEKLAIFDHVDGVIWLMNEYGVKESWTKILVHGLSQTPLVKPMIFYDNGKVVFVNRNLKVLNNAEEKCLGKSDDVLWDKKVLELKVQGTYVESLFLPKIGTTN